MNGWFVLEMFGRQYHVGYITEVEVFGVKMGHIKEIKRSGETGEFYFPGSSIYRLTPVTEEEARARVAPYSVPVLAAEFRVEDDDDDNEAPTDFDPFDDDLPPARFHKRPEAAHPEPKEEGQPTLVDQPWPRCNCRMCLCVSASADRNGGPCAECAIGVHQG